MGIDKKTKVGFLSVSIKDNEDYLNSLRWKADDEGYNDDDGPFLLLDDDEHSCETHEYYFDDTTGEIVYSGTLTTDSGKSNVYLSIELSDVLLVDILNHAIKKFNKLKSVMESLK